MGQKTVQRLSKETVDEWFNQYSKSLGKILHFFSGRNLSVHIVSSGQSEADPKNKIKREGLNPQLGRGDWKKISDPKDVLQCFSYKLFPK